MTTSVLALSRYITYRMAYDDSTRLRCHYYYINLDARRHFVLGGHGYFMSLRCVVFLLPWMTMSVCDFFLPNFSSFVSMCWTRSLLCWIIPCPYFQRTPWLRAVPFVEYLCVSTPSLLHGTSKITLPVVLW